MPRGLLEIGNSLIHSFLDALGPGGLAENGEKAKLESLEVREFDHIGKQVRGLASTVAISKGEILLVVPRPLRLPVEEALQERFVGGRQLKKPSVNQAALWLAEKRLAFANDDQVSRSKVSKETQPRSASFWKTYIDSLPSYGDLQVTGIPLLQPSSALKPLSELPLQVSIIPKYVFATRKELEADLRFYNEHRGDRPQLSWEDALWGRAITDSRAFECNGPTFAPVGDMLNTTAGPSNVEVVCDEDVSSGSLMMFTAKKDIEAGEELTASYSNGTEGLIKSGGAGTWLVKKFGTAVGAPAEPWPEDVCSAVAKANLSRSSNALWQSIYDLSKKNCSPNLRSTDSNLNPAGATADAGKAMMKLNDDVEEKMPSPKVQSVTVPLDSLALLQHRQWVHNFGRNQATFDCKSGVASKCRTSARRFRQNIYLRKDRKEFDFL